MTLGIVLANLRAIRILAESLAAGLNRDALLDTRLMLSEQFYSPDVQGIPVYGGLQQFADSREALVEAEQALTIEIIQKLPVPDHDTSLENLVLLRQTPKFRRALDDLLEWKRDKAPAIVLAKDSKAAIAAAMRDFDKLTKAYAEAMEAEGHKKAQSVGSKFFFDTYRRASWGDKGDLCVFPGVGPTVLEKNVGYEVCTGRCRVSLSGSGPVWDLIRTRPFAYRSGTVSVWIIGTL
jgi:hypothetical protein